MPSLNPRQLEELVPDYAGMPVFVETGTYRGGTIFSMEPLFNQLHTIELSEALWRAVSKGYQRERISFHLGQSVEVLSSILPGIEQPAVFFLDAHWSCGDTAKGDVDVPLLEELSVISKFFAPGAVIIIDDLRLFKQGPHSGEPVDWTQVDQERVMKAVGDRCLGWTEHSALDKLTIRLAAKSGD